MKNLLTEGEKAALLDQFHSLASVSEKLAFWTKKLPINFIQYWELGTEQSDLFTELRDFDISDQQESEVFAKWVLKNYYDLSKSHRKYELLLSYDLLTSNFQKKLDDEVNKLDFIRNELRDLSGSFKQSYSKTNRFGGGHQINNYKYNADFVAFEAYKDFQLAPNYKTVIPSLFTILRTENGFTLGRYWEYLKGLEKDYQSSSEVKEATLDQKLLLLHYLDALPKIRKSENATKTSLFLEKLLGNNAERIRQRFSSINDLFTPSEKAKRKKLREELELVEEMFKELGSETIAKKVRIDIKKLSQ